MGKFEDLTGQRFGKLIVIQQAKSIKDKYGRNIIQWSCKCDCGKETIAKTGALKSGNKKSCGCSCTRLSNLSGKKFGHLRVLERENDIGSLPIWKCQCDCGNIISVYASNLRTGNTKSCGCLSRKMASEKIRTDLSGRKYGKLNVIQRIEDKKTKNNENVACYKCLCDCGKYINVRGSNLTSGHTTSCGCNSSRNNIGNQQRKHGMSNSRIHVVWQIMKARCYNLKSESYNCYGGRGIKVCDEWLGENGAENFIEWAYKTGYDENAKHGECTLDRIDVNGDYEPSNCRWITIKQQCNNKRNNIIISYKGKTQTLTQWCEELNLNYQRVRERIKSGWDFERAAFTPVRSIGHKK